MDRSRRGQTAAISPSPEEPRGQQGSGEAFGDAGDNFILTVADIISSLGTLVPLALVLLFAVLALRWGRRMWRARKAKSHG